MPLPNKPNMNIVPAVDLGSRFHRQKLAGKLNVRNGSKAVISDAIFPAAPLSTFRWLLS